MDLQANAIFAQFFAFEIKLELSEADRVLPVSRHSFTGKRTTGT